jgi:type II secretion system protein G
MGDEMFRPATSRARDVRRGENGFTLIELLIVIVILGILAAIVAFSVRGITDRGDLSACKAEVKTVATAQEAYYAKTGSYPATLAALAADPDKFLRSANTKYVTGVNAADGTLTVSGPAGCNAA